MRTKTAGKLMIPLDKYPHIPYWFTVREAIAILHRSELDINGKKSLARAVLVFNEEYKLIGMIRRRDILRGLEPKNLFSTDSIDSKKFFNIESDPNLLELSLDALINSIKEKAEVTVGEVMVPIQRTIDYHDHLMKIIYQMGEYRQSLLAVMKDEVVVGVIRTVEVMDEIGKVLNIG